MRSYLRATSLASAQNVSAAPGSSRHEPGRRLSNFEAENGFTELYRLGKQVSFIALPTRNFNVVFAGI